MTDRDLTCQELVELVTDYLEGGLAAPERARFEEHLALCVGCAHYLDQLRRTVELLGRLPAEALAPPVRDQLLAIFRGWRA